MAKKHNKLRLVETNLAETAERVLKFLTDMRVQVQPDNTATMSVSMVISQPTWERDAKLLEESGAITIDNDRINTAYPIVTFNFDKLVELANPSVSQSHIDAEQARTARKALVFLLGFSGPLEDRATVNVERVNGHLSSSERARLEAAGALAPEKQLSAVREFDVARLKELSGISMQTMLAEARSRSV